jgi:uncharacterized protein
MSGPTIAIEKQFLEEFCLRHRIRRLALFGSILTPRFRPDSDVDILVEFEPGARITYLDLAGMEEELSLSLGRKADLRTPRELSRYFRDKVLSEAVIQYERA